MSIEFEKTVWKMTWPHSQIDLCSWPKCSRRHPNFLRQPFLIEFSGTILSRLLLLRQALYMNVDCIFDQSLKTNKLRKSNRIQLNGKNANNLDIHLTNAVYGWAKPNDRATQLILSRYVLHVCNQFSITLSKSLSVFINHGWWKCEYVSEWCITHTFSAMLEIAIRCDNAVDSINSLLSAFPIYWFVIPYKWNLCWLNLKTDAV